jgi:hypothetical protein
MLMLEDTPDLLPRYTVFAVFLYGLKCPAKRRLPFSVAAQNEQRRENALYKWGERLF